MHNKLAPILIFTYRRIDTLDICINDLRVNPLASESDLYIFSDGPKGKIDHNEVKEVREYILTIDGFKSITLRSHNNNIGLAHNIIAGVNEVIRKEKKVIVLEDDLRLGKYFLTFMNDALNKYQNNKKICCVSGYSYFSDFLKNEIYFLDNQADCLGWGTWENRWLDISFDDVQQFKILKKKKLMKKLDRNFSYPYKKLLKSNQNKKKSWAINFLSYAVLENVGTIYPSKSLVLHTSVSNKATNYSILDDTQDPYKVDLSQEKIDLRDTALHCSAINEMKYRKWLRKFEKNKIIKFGRALSQFSVYLKAQLEKIGINKAQQIQ
jgi:hypothetical protein